MSDIKERLKAIELLFNSSDIEESILYLVQESEFHQQLQTQFCLMIELLNHMRAYRNVLLKFPDVPEERKHRLKMLIVLLKTYKQSFIDELSTLDQ